MIGTSTRSGLPLMQFVSKHHVVELVRVIDIEARVWDD
jgi:hypothetical protein